MLSLDKRSEFELALKFPYEQEWVKRAKEIKGCRWDPLSRVWLFPYTLANLERFLDLFDDAVCRYDPNLIPKIAWNQPMFTDHDTFIIGFSVAKHHLAVAPEKAGIIHFSDEIVQAGYDHTGLLVTFQVG